MTRSAAREGGGPHVLLLPSWYPTADNPVAGVFFREQAHALARHGGARVGVAAPLLRGVRTIREGRLLEWRYQDEFEDDGGVATFRAFGWNVPRAGRLNQRVWTALARRMARRYRARFGTPDVIHAHGAIWAARPAAEIAAEWGIPAVVTEHTSAYAEGRVPPWQLSWARAGFRGAARVIAVSRALARELEPLAGGTPVEVVPNLVETTFFTLPPGGRRGGEGPFRFLAVALFLPVKRMDVLVDAFAAAFGADPRARLEIVGGGEGEAAVRARVRGHGLEGRVEFSGIRSRDGVREAMWRADALVVSSDVETFNVSAVEAMATGLPVVSTACGGPQDTVVPGETGVLVPPGDPAALGAAMRGVADGAEAWRARAEAIRAHADARFSQPVVVRRLLRTYAEAAGAAAPAPLPAGR